MLDIATVGQTGMWVLGPPGKEYGMGNGSRSDGTTLCSQAVHADVESSYDGLGGPVPRPIGSTFGWVPTVVVAAGWVGPTLDFGRIAQV